MLLQIEDKILLKECTRAWKPDGWGQIPTGWTPDECSEWVLTRSEEMLQEAHDKELVTSREFTRRAAAIEYGAVLYAQKKPWPGWVPITVQYDRGISKAYRRYFVELNEHIDAKELGLITKLGRKSERAQWPPDGFYELRNGRIHPMENKNGL